MLSGAASADIFHRGNGVAFRRVVVGPLETNCWIVHAIDAEQAVVLDPGADPAVILDALDGLTPVAVVLTHAHFDHVLGVPGLLAAHDVPVYAHPDEAQVWRHEVEQLNQHGHFDAGTATDTLLASAPELLTAAADDLWDGTFRPISGGGTWRLPGGPRLRFLHTPGHTPGGLSIEAAGHLFTGDTLFPGGPGLTGWPLSDFPTVMTSVRRLLDLPGTARVHPGHGADTTIAAERPSVDEWERRGW